ncbi:MAG: hypothetical protein K0S93_80 [Nitrososphaeraceae archaeon]|jgi:hypothetical protein|nr:hypothetical protein [Nitrososphaeraceae archaeon]
MKEKCGCKYHKRNIQRYYQIALDDPETKEYEYICDKHLREFVLRDFNAHQWHLTAQKTFNRVKEILK